MPCGFTYEELKASYDRHTRELEHLIQEHAQPTEIAKMRASMDSLIKYMEEAENAVYAGRIENHS